MRQIVMFNRVSAEGQFATVDGAMDWITPEPEIDKLGVSGMAHTDTVLFGRRTYEQFASFWPHVLDDSETAPDPHAPGRRSPELRAMAEWLNQANKLVFSRTLKRASWNNTHLMGELNAKEVESLKRKPGKSLIVFGSGSIVTALTQHGLIDEYRIIVCPLFLGSGKPLLGALSKRVKLELLEAKAYPAGNVMLRYGLPK
jgi:dihydrofolate reductase